MVVLPFLTSFYGNGETKFPKKLNSDWACPQAAQLEGAIRKSGSLCHHE